MQVVVSFLLAHWFLEHIFTNINILFLLYERIKKKTKMKAVRACWWLRRDLDRLTLHSGPPATRYLLRWQTCWCLLQTHTQQVKVTRVPNVALRRSCSKKSWPQTPTRWRQAPKSCMYWENPVLLHLTAAALTKSAQWSSLVVNLIWSEPLT